MSDREPVERNMYRTFSGASEFVNFMYSKYHATVTGFGLTQGPVDSYDALRRFWCETRGVDDANIEAWLMDRTPDPESTDCSDMDTEHGQVLVLIDQLRNPEQFFSTISIIDGDNGNSSALLMPPAVYVRELLQGGAENE